MLTTFLKSRALPCQPEDWPRVFAQHLNAGDLDAVMDLYEPEARSVARSGETLLELPHKAIEVLRRQPDGSWKLIMGDPNGRERENH